jgi:hypothetical protein
MSDSAIRMAAKQRPVVVLNRAIADVPCVITDIPPGGCAGLSNILLSWGIGESPM